MTVRIFNGSLFKRQLSTARVVMLGRGPSSSHTTSPERAAHEAMFQYTSVHGENFHRVSVDLIGSARLQSPFGTGDGHGVIWGLFNGFLKALDDSLSSDDIFKKYQSWIPYYSSDGIVSVSDHAFLLEVNDASNPLATLYPVGGRFQIASSIDPINKIYHWQSEGSGITFLNHSRVFPEKQSISDVSTSLNKLSQSFINGGCKTCNGCSRSIKKSSSIDLTWQPHSSHSFFDFSYLFSNNFKVSNRVIDLIYFSVFNGMKANDMGRETIIFPTKGSSGIGFAAWAICYYNHFPLEDLLGYADEYFQQYLAAGASTAASKEGCMAETGPAAAGLAYGLVLINKGSNEHALAAARFMHLMIKGLTCLPDDGAVRSPCTERDALFALVAMSASMLVLSQNIVIDIDEWREELLDCIAIGQRMPVTMKETMDSETFFSVNQLKDNIPESINSNYQWHPTIISRNLKPLVVQNKKIVSEAFVYKIMAFAYLSEDLFIKKEVLPDEFYTALINGMAHYINLMPLSFLEEWYPTDILTPVAKELLSPKQHMD